MNSQINLQIEDLHDSAWAMFSLWLYSNGHWICGTVALGLLIFTLESRNAK